MQETWANIRTNILESRYLKWHDFNVLIKDVRAMRTLNGPRSNVDREEKRCCAIQLQARISEGEEGKQAMQKLVVKYDVPSVIKDVRIALQCSGVIKLQVK